MAVYVDAVEHQFGNMLMCHLWADTEEELLEMVDKINVDRKWIQGHPTLSFGKHKRASWVHFDIAKSKKALAIRAGAILTDRYGPLAHTSRLGLEAAQLSGNKEAESRHMKMLATIAELRADG